MKKNIGKAFETLFNIKASKIEKLLKDYRLNDLLITPGIIPGLTIEQHEMIGVLNKWTRAITAENFSYKKNADPKDTARYLYSLIGGRKSEIFIALLFNKNDELIKSVRLAEGGVNSALIYPQSLSRTAVEYDAASIVIAHNHPSGHPEFSTDDKNTWQNLRENLKAINVEISDCFVIGDGNFCSKDYPYPKEFNQSASTKIQLDVPQKRNDLQYRESLSHRLSSYTNLEKSVVSDIALKIAETALNESPNQNIKINGPIAAAQEIERIVNHTGADSGVLFLNTKNQVIGNKTVKIPITDCQRKILTANALKHNAVGAILFRRELEEKPAGTPLLKNSDYTAHNAIEKHLKNAGINLVDSLVFQQQDDQFVFVSLNTESTESIQLSQSPPKSTRRNRK